MFCGYINITSLDERWQVLFIAFKNLPNLTAFKNLPNLTAFKNLPNFIAFKNLPNLT